MLDLDCIDVQHGTPHLQGPTRSNTEAEENMQGLHGFRIARPGYASTYPSRYTSRTASKTSADGTGSPSFDQSKLLEFLRTSEESVSSVGQSSALPDSPRKGSLGSHLSPFNSFEPSAAPASEATAHSQLAGQAPKATADRPSAPKSPRSYGFGFSRLPSTDVDEVTGPSKTPKKAPGSKRARELAVLDHALGLYHLTQYRILFEPTSDTKAIVAWNKHTILISFRGTASLKAVRLDLEVRDPVPHLVEQCTSFLQIHSTR